MKQLSDSRQADAVIIVTERMLDEGAMALIESDTDQVSWQGRALRAFVAIMEASEGASGRRVQLETGGLQLHQSLR